MSTSMSIDEHCGAEEVGGKLISSAPQKAAYLPMPAGYHDSKSYSLSSAVNYGANYFPESGTSSRSTTNYGFSNSQPKYSTSPRSPMSGLLEGSGDGCCGTKSSSMAKTIMSNHKDGGCC